MTSSTLSLPLQQELQRFAQDWLQKLLDPEDDAEELPPCPAEEIRWADLLAFPVQTARNAYRRHTRRPEDQAWGTLALQRLAELRTCYQTAAKKPATSSVRQAWLVSLTYFASAIMIPQLARAGRYAEAVELVKKHLALVLSKAYQAVSGAGSEVVHGPRGPERVPEARLILLSPVLWSLVAHYPIPV